jgi:FKBP-type peptidyl-prolyl cis-trans isomerase (trigger factor)
VIRLIPLFLTLLVACGPGSAPAAAVVGDREISMEMLEQEFNALIAQPEFARQLEGPTGEEQRKDLTRQLLSFLIQVEVFDEYARTHGLSVTPREVEQQLQVQIQQAGGPEAFDREIEAQGLTIPAVRRNLQRNILFSKVQGAVLDDAGIAEPREPDEANRAILEWFRGRLAALDVTVNPRFGRLDQETGQVEPVTSTG